MKETDIRHVLPTQNDQFSSACSCNIDLWVSILADTNSTFHNAKQPLYRCMSLFILLFQIFCTWQRQLDQQAVYTMVCVEFVDQVQ